jgi:hypothetical protein
MCVGGRPRIQSERQRRRRCLCRKRDLSGRSGPGEGVRRSGRTSAIRERECLRGRLSTSRECVCLFVRFSDCLGNGIGHRRQRQGQDLGHGRECLGGR